MASGRVQVEFAWPVPNEGFRWFMPNDNLKGGPWLIPADPDEPEREWRLTDPFTDTPTLFRAFANLEEDKEAELLGFANRFGLLGAPGDLQELDVPGVGKCWGESRGAWSSTVEAMRFAVRLWDAIGAKSEKETREWLEKVQTRWGNWLGTRLVGTGPLVAHYFEDDYDLGERDPFETEDLYDGATSFLVAVINGMLLRQTSLVVAHDEGAPCIQAVPASLWGCLWTQLAREFTGESKLRRCTLCGNPFTVNPGIGKRRHRKFCSEKCRASAYRNRQEHARRMRLEGMTPSAIAKRLGSDPATVRGWVTSAAKTTRRERS